jgi:plastocyanin
MGTLRLVLIASLIVILAAPAACASAAPAPTVSNSTTTPASQNQAAPPATPVPAANQTPAAPPAQAPDTVLISNYQYIPATLSVKVGTVVTWTNQDPDEHTVTSYNKTFDSGLISHGKSFSFNFTKPGTYNYFCIPHPDMVGTVIVQ